MKIQYKKDHILIQTANSKVAIGNYLKLKADDAEIFISQNPEISGDLADKLIVVNPGEYELHGVMIQALPKPGSSEMMLYSIDIDGVNIVFISSKEKNITKKIIDQIGVNNILIISIDDDLEGLRDLVEDIDPNYLIPLSRDKDVLEKISKKLGIALPQSEKTLSVNIDTFDTNSEDTIMQIILLD